MFLRLLKELQDGLEADGLTEELEILTSSLSDSIRSAILGRHTHSPVLSSSLNHLLGKVVGGGEREREGGREGEGGWEREGEGRERAASVGRPTAVAVWYDR